MYTKKEDIEKWLDQMSIHFYTIRINNIIDIHENVKLNGSMYELPVQFGIIEGDFDCSNLGLETLKGCPDIVEGCFKCTNNNLISLEYSPKKVNGEYHCNYNKLTNLKGLPKELNSNLFCFMNSLTTLEYVPSYIKGDFMCSYNNLSSFEHFPLIVDGMLNFFDNNIPKNLLYTFNTKTKGPVIQDFFNNSDMFLREVEQIKTKIETEILLNNIINTSLNIKKTRL